MSRWILMRHAHAAASPSGSDRDRPLTEGGRADAARIGAWLLTNDWVPDRVLCSPATRTLETYALTSAAWPGAPEAVTDEALYLASPVTYQGCLEAAGTTMLVGHNPTMHDFVAAHAPGVQDMRPGTAACFEDGRLVQIVSP